LKVHLHQSLKIKSQKEVPKYKNSRFFLLFLLNDGRIRIWIQKAHKHTDPTDPDHNTDAKNVIKLILDNKFIVLTLLTGSRTNEWNILNIENFSLLPSSPFAANGWGWTPFKDSKKPILRWVIGPRLVRICQLSVSAGQLAELCVHTAGICMAGTMGWVWKIFNIVRGFC
jgi:hypothetical protein